MGKELSDMSEEQASQEMEANRVLVGLVPGQLPGESARAYAAFVEFYRRGPDCVLKDLGRKLKVAGATMSYWRKKFLWDTRARDHGVAATGGGAEVSKEWAKKHEEIRQAEWDLHVETLKAGKEALRRWQEGGRVPSLGEVARILEVSSRLARLASGMPLDYSEISVEATGQVSVDFEAALERVYGKKRAMVVEVESERVEVTE
jgi:hypothetical protein